MYNCAYKSTALVLDHVQAVRPSTVRSGVTEAVTMGDVTTAAGVVDASVGSSDHATINSLSSLTAFGSVTYGWEMEILNSSGYSTLDLLRLVVVSVVIGFKFV